MKFLPTLPFSAEYVQKLVTVLVDGDICGKYGYALSLQPTGARRICVLFPYGKPSTDLGPLNTEISSDRLFVSGRKPPTKFTFSEPTKVNIEPLYDDFLIYRDYRLIRDVLNVLKEQFEVVFLHRAYDVKKLKYAQRSKNKEFVLLLGRGEDIYPGDVDRDGTIVAMVYTEFGILLNATFSNKKDMFNCDGENLESSPLNPEKALLYTDVYKHTLDNPKIIGEEQLKTFYKKFINDLGIKLNKKKISTHWGTNTAGWFTNATYTVTTTGTGIEWNATTNT